MGIDPFAAPLVYRRPTIEEVTSAAGEENTPIQSVADGAPTLAQVAVSALPAVTGFGDSAIEGVVTVVDAAGPV
jgi:hypothetical protein